MAPQTPPPEPSAPQGSLAASALQALLGSPSGAAAPAELPPPYQMNLDRPIPAGFMPNYRMSEQQAPNFRMGVDDLDPREIGPSVAYGLPPRPAPMPLMLNSPMEQFLKQQVYNSQVTPEMLSGMTGHQPIYRTLPSAAGWEGLGPTVQVGGGGGEAGRGMIEALLGQQRNALSALGDFQGNQSRIAGLQAAMPDPDEAMRGLELQRAGQITRAREAALAPEKATADYQMAMSREGQELARAEREGRQQIFQEEEAKARLAGQERAGARQERIAEKGIGPEMEKVALERRKMEIGEKELPFMNDLQVLEKGANWLVAGGSLDDMPTSVRNRFVNAQHPLDTKQETVKAKDLDTLGNDVTDVNKFINAFRGIHGQTTAANRIKATNRMATDSPFAKKVGGRQELIKLLEDQLHDALESSGAREVGDYRREEGSFGGDMVLIGPGTKRVYTRPLGVFGQVPDALRSPEAARTSYLRAVDINRLIYTLREGK